MKTPVKISVITFHVALRTTYNHKYV